MYINESATQIPSTQAYKTAFLQLGRIHKNYVSMLQAHRVAPNFDVTATELADAVGYQNFNAANLHYGKLGSYIGELLRLPQPEFCVKTLVTFRHDGVEWHWIMRPEVIQTLDQVNWKLCRNKIHMESIVK
jgi:hypothetical protein